MNVEQIETVNDHLVGVQGDKVVMVLPPIAPMSHEEALRLAAWIVAITDDYDRFEAILDAILDESGPES